MSDVLTLFNQCCWEEERKRFAHQSQTNFVLLSFSANSSHREGAEPLCQKTEVTVYSSSSSEEVNSFQKPPPPYHVDRKARKNREPRGAAQAAVESQYETGYTTGDTGNELDRDHTEHLYRQEPNPWGFTILIRSRAWVWLPGLTI